MLILHIAPDVDDGLRREPREEHSARVTESAPRPPPAPKPHLRKSKWVPSPGDPFSHPSSQKINANANKVRSIDENQQSGREQNGQRGPSTNGEKSTFLIPPPVTSSSYS
jgi:hypothetical protein